MSSTDSPSPASGSVAEPSSTTLHHSGSLNTHAAPETLSTGKLNLWRGIWVIAALELKQRRRSVALRVFFVIWFIVIGLVTGATWLFSQVALGSTADPDASFVVVSVIICFVLLFASLVAPAISAASVNGERAAGTLATTQVTLISTWSLLLGKALAAWLLGLSFLAVASPFLALSAMTARSGWLQTLVALLVLAIQIGIFTMIGVGLSALIRSSLFSIVSAYLLIAFLSLGTVITFALAVGTTVETVTVMDSVFSEEYYQKVEACEGDEACIAKVPVSCEPEASEHTITHHERLWWILAANPYVMLSDMIPVRTIDGVARMDDVFSGITYAVLSLQNPMDMPEPYDACAFDQYDSDTSGESTPIPLRGSIGWIGLSLQLLLVSVLLWVGYTRLNTPASRVPKGSRIA